MKKTITFTLTLSLFAFSALASGSKSPTNNTEPTTPGAFPLGEKCIQIFYDAPQNGSANNLNYAKRVTTNLLNLLGHFPEWEQGLKSVNTYKKSDIERCPVNFYLGAFYDNDLPESFVSDFQSTQKTAVWIAYNIWKIPNRALYDMWGMRYTSIDTLDYRNVDEFEEPGYYRYFDYKGQTFHKYGRWNDDSRSEFWGDGGMVKMAPVSTNANKNVMSWATHSVTKNKTPYIIHKSGKWFVADIPWSYVHTADRYLIFADMLFDILDEKPKHAKKPAFIRIEDVHPKISTSSIDTYADYFQSKKVPFSISLIPHYKKAVEGQGVVESLTALEAPEWVAGMKLAKSKGASFIYHGYTHQSDDHLNPEGSSGPDWEFWDWKNGKPMPQDSVEWMLGRLETGFKMLDETGLLPSAFIAPHYAASALDYAILGQVMSWQVGRAQYSGVPTIKQSRKLPIQLNFNNANSAQAPERAKFFVDLKVETEDLGPMEGQFFPYEIYGDLYGQRILPENLHYVSENSVESIKAKIEDIKRNSVIRDSWASFYIHPWILESDHANVSAALSELIDTARSLGYEFINLDKWASENTKPVRKATVQLK